MSAIPNIDEVFGNSDPPTPTIRNPGGCVRDERGDAKKAKHDDPEPQLSRLPYDRIYAEDECRKAGILRRHFAKVCAGHRKWPEGEARREDERKQLRRLERRYADRMCR